MFEKLATMKQIADFDYSQVDENKENDFLFGNSNPYIDYIANLED